MNCLFSSPIKQCILGVVYYLVSLTIIKLISRFDTGRTVLPVIQVSGNKAYIIRRGFDREWAAGHFDTHTHSV
jgi:hypothetical protein